MPEDRRRAKIDKIFDRYLEFLDEMEEEERGLEGTGEERDEAFPLQVGFRR